jgi:hypothetical protein
MIKSINKVNLEDGQYDALWSDNYFGILPKSYIAGNLVTLSDEEIDQVESEMTEVEVNEFFTKKYDESVNEFGTIKVDIINGWVYCNLTIKDRRDLIINEFI